MLAAALLAACAGEATGPRGVVLQAEASYSLPPQTALLAPFSIVNHGSTTVQVPTCGDRVTVLVDREQDGAWVEAYGGACPANLSMVPVSLAPGGVLDGRVPFGTGGTFRLRLPLDARQAVSRRFTVR